MKKRMKSFAAIILSLVLFSGLFMVNNTEADARRVYFQVYNCNSYVTLRSSPSTKARAITTIPYGREVLWCYGYNNGKTKNGFYKVIYGNRTGYVLANYLGRSYRAKVVKCNSYITLRKSPSTKATALKRIPKGAIITYETNSKNGFCRVNYKGKLGYVLRSYVQVYY